MKLRSLAALSTFLFLAVALRAQSTSPPDFSGSWVLNISKSTLAKDSTVKSETLVVDNKKGAINFRYKIDGKKSTDTYTPDGQNHVAKDLGSSQLMSAASWKESTLVVETVLQIKIPGISVSGVKPIVVKWYLSADGRTLTNEADDAKEIYVFEKQ
jgi:hypothetical protein